MVPAMVRECPAIITDTLRGHGANITGGTLITGRMRHDFVRILGEKPSSQARLFGRQISIAEDCFSSKTIETSAYDKRNAESNGSLNSVMARNLSSFARKRR